MPVAPDWFTTILSLSADPPDVDRPREREVVSRHLRVILLAAAYLLAACSGGDSVDESSGPVAESEAEDNATTSSEVPAETEEPAAQPTDDAAPALGDVVFEAGACAFDTPPNFTVECGWVEVPQRWDDATDSDTIRLHVATFTNDNTPTDATPVVYLEGGPGGDVFGAAFFTVGDQFGPIVDDHPLVMFSQRGSALTEIDLECEEVLDLTIEQLTRLPDDVVDDAEAVEAARACSTRLQNEGADLTAYHSVASANDVDAIRAALGHDQWNVLGISYGTRLGQELARTHPDGIRSLILDSVQPTDPRFGSLAAIPSTFEQALEQLYAGCETNIDCSREYPDLEERLLARIDAADASPIEVEVANQLTGEFFDVVIDGDRLVEMVFQSLYSPTLFSALPEMVNELENGQTATLSALTGLAVTNAPFIAHGMNTAVMCHDYQAELTPDAAWASGLTGNELFDERFAGGFQTETAELCEIFPTGSADSSVTEPVESSIPTLLLAGAYDPITPSGFAEAVAPGFSAGQLVVLPHAGHGVIGADCGMQIALDFFESPMDAVDTGCVEGSTEPPWIPSSLAGTNFVPFEDAQLGVAGVVPEGWSDQGLGVFVRDDANIARQVVLVQQGAPLPETQLINLVQSQFGGDVVEDGAAEVGGQTWSRWRLSEGIADGVMFTRTENAFTFIVLVQASSSDLEDLETHVVPTVLEAIDLLS